MTALNLKSAAAISIFAFSSAAIATTTTVLQPCSTSDVKVSSVQQFDSVSATAVLGPNLLPGEPLASFACAGAYAGNDMPKPTINLGYLGDGLLNGAERTSPPPAVTFFPEGAFVTDADKTDLDGDGLADDPGWVMLGRLEYGSGGFGGFITESVNGDTTIILSSFFSATQTEAGKGTWAFTPDPLVAVRAFSVFGKNTFDQFALIFKSGPAFAAYDFTAAQFGVTNPSADDPQFNFAGSWDTTATLINCNDKKCNPAGISHISVWARDPGDTNTVPEPAPLALIGLAAVAFWASRRRYC